MSFRPSDYFDLPISRDFFEMLCGEHLGSGAARTVYMHAGFPDKMQVIKIEHAAGRFQNVAEWQVWEHIKQVKELNQWFAPCLHISPCGNVLTQQYARDLEGDWEIPAKIPAFFTDLKMANFGIMYGRFVCRDYGHHLLLEMGMTKRMVKPKFHD